MQEPYDVAKHFEIMTSKLARMSTRAQKVVQQLLGHATMEMTLRYAHLAPELMDDAVRTLDGDGPAWSRRTVPARGTNVAPRPSQGANIVN